MSPIPNKSMNGATLKKSESENSGKWEDEGGIYMKGEGLSPVDEGEDEAEEEDTGLMMYDPVEAGVPSVPDGGYGWVIVFTSFMCNMIVDGIANCFGVFLPVLAAEFQLGKGSVAWANSLLCGVYLLMGPVVSALTNKFGCRPVCIAGSIVAATGFGLSALATDLSMLILTYGIIGGVGFGLIYLPAVVCVGYYFESKRAFATGIAVCGSGVGTIVFAPFASFLLKNLQPKPWQYSNLVFAGLILSCGLFGMLMKPLEVQIHIHDENEDDPEQQDGVSKNKPLLQRMADDKKSYMDKGSISGSAYFMVQLPDGTMERRLKMPLNVDPGVHSSFNLDQLVPGSTLTTVPTLPTIAESKPVGVSGSGRVSAERESPDSEIPKSTNIPIPNRGGPRRNSESVAYSSSPSSNPGTPSSSAKEREGVVNRTPSKPIPSRKSSTGIVGDMPRNGSAPQFNNGRSIPKNVSVPVFHQMQRKHSFKAVPVGSGHPHHESKSNLTDRRRSSIKTSLNSFVTSKSKITGTTGNTGSTDDEYSTEISEGLIFGSTEEPRRIVRPLSRKDIFYAGSIANLPEYQTQRSFHAYHQSILAIPRSETAADTLDAEMMTTAKPSKYSCLGGAGAFKSALGQMMDFSLMKNPVFIAIAISNVFGMLGFYVPLVYIADSAMQSGIDASSSSLLVSIIGVTNTIGRVLCGVISDRPEVNTLFMNNVCILISGICVICVPFCSQFYSYVIVAAVFGLFVSGYISLTSIILVDLLGLDNLTNAFGLLIMFRGAASIIGSPLAGALYDTFKNYEIPFYVAGGFFIVCAAISFMVPWITKFAPEKKILHPPHYQVAYLEDIPEAAESHNSGSGELDENGKKREKFDQVESSL